MSVEWLNHKLAILTYCARKPCPQRSLVFTVNKMVEAVKPHTYKTKSPFRKLTDDQVRFIRISKDTLKTLSEHLGVAESTVWHVKRKRSYKDII